jgi:hypothetical protein
MEIPILVAFTFTVIISSCIIYYLKHLEEIGCKCALNYKRDYILYFTVINLFFATMNVFAGHTAIYRMVMLVVSLPLVIAGIVNIVYTIQFVNDVKENNCNCSESLFREIMFILAIVNASVWILFILIVIPIVLMYPSQLKTIITNKKFLKKYIKNGRPNNAI